MSEFHFHPIRSQAHTILSAILSSPEVSSCPLKVVMVIRLACEEIIMNVTSYAYPEGSDGFLDVDIEKTDRVIITFTDGGTPFNPLEREKPDTMQPWKERQIGGLGILLVLKKMDNVQYAYVDNKNVLTIEKVI